MIDREEPGPERCCAGRTTMLELVQSLTRAGLSECDVVSTVHQLIESGQATLVGSFRDTRLEKPSDEPNTLRRLVEP